MPLKEVRLEEDSKFEPEGPFEPEEALKEEFEAKNRGSCCFPPEPLGAVEEFGLFSRDDEDVWEEGLFKVVVLMLAC